MLNSIQQLAELGIHSWGSDRLLTYERHLTRYFTREYNRLDTDIGSAQVFRQTGEPSEMAEKTDQLMDEHYDAPLALFRGFLDHHYMAYTMAYYGDSPNSIGKSEATLEQAQAQKFALAAKRIGLQGAERILNIGCGFGSFETWLFENYPQLNVYSLTPSKVQADYIRQCQRDVSHVMPTDSIKLFEKTFEQLDWKDVDSEPFDLVFAVGVFEHIANLQIAFRKIYNHLKPGGRCFLHLIVSKPVFPQFMNSDDTLIGRYFPGGRIWPFNALTQYAGKLELVGKWYINGMNYWRTLEEWHRLYWENLDKLYPNVLNSGEVKYWNEYFVLCKAMFGPMGGDIYGNGHYVFHRPE